MGKLTLFTKDGCSDSGRVKQLLRKYAPAEVNEISLTTSPEWTTLLFLLVQGDKSVPQVFFNSVHVGGVEEMEKMEKEGALEERVKECVEGGSDGEFPPPLRTPEDKELVEIIPVEVRKKWQESLESMETILKEATGRQISSLVITLETPGSILVICTAGQAKDTFVVGASVKKGSEDSQAKAYCQVALEKQISLFVTDPLQVEGLQKNELMLNLGYSYYAGAPWGSGKNRGTVVAMEKEAGILIPEHMTIVEATRDEIATYLTTYKQQQKSC